MIVAKLSRYTHWPVRRYAQLWVSVAPKGRLCSESTHVEPGRAAIRVACRSSGDRYASRFGSASLRCM